MNEGWRGGGGNSNGRRPGLAWSGAGNYRRKMITKRIRWMTRKSWMQYAGQSLAAHRILNNNKTNHFMNETNNQLNEQTSIEVRTVERKARRPRSDSNWKNLTMEQCETVEKWLFEERLSYPETAARVKKEFGLETSVASVGRYYRNRARVRRSLEILEAQVNADKLGMMPARTEELRAGAVKLVAKNAMTLGVERPEDMEGLNSLTRVLLKSEENEIRLRRVKLEERYYDFEANTMCAKELEKVRSYLRTVGDNENLSHEEKLERVIGLLFGKDKVKDVEETEEEEGRDGILT